MIPTACIVRCDMRHSALAKCQLDVCNTTYASQYTDWLLCTNEIGYKYIRILELDIFILLCFYLRRVESQKTNQEGETRSIETSEAVASSISAPIRTLNIKRVANAKQKKKKNYRDARREKKCKKKRKKVTKKKTVI